MSDVMIPRARVLRMRPETEARVLGLIVLIAGIAGVASVLVPPSWERMRVAETILTPWGTGIAEGAAAILGVGLIVVGRGVVHRQRIALWTAVALLIASTGAHIASGFDVGPAAVNVAGAWLLVRNRKLFVVDPGRARFATLGKLTARLTAVVLAYGMLGFATHAHRVRPSFTPVRAIWEIGARLIGLTGPLTIPGRFGRWFLPSLTVLGGVSLGALLLTAVAPVALRGGGEDHERDDLRAMLGRADEDTLAPFVLRRDKRYAFSPDRRAAIAFRYLQGVGLAAGDPIGDPASFGAAIDEFLALCRQMGWKLAIVGAHETVLPLYAERGLRSIYIGDEAVIDVASFSLEGRKIRNVRQSVNHARRAGITTEMYREGDLDVRLRRQLLRVAAAQRKDHPEYGFSMALGEQFSGRHPECFVIVARDALGEPVGFQRYVPCRRGKAFSLDSMRRAPGSVGGVNELMIVDAVAWAKARNSEAVSLNFSAVRMLMESGAELERLQSIAVWTIRRFEGKFGVQLDTLRRFNAKFLPRWVPRYAIYRTPADIPAIGIAAYSAEGFLPFDQKSRLQAETVDA